MQYCPVLKLVAAYNEAHRESDALDLIDPEAADVIFETANAMYNQIPFAVPRCPEGVLELTAYITRWNESARSPMCNALAPQATARIEEIIRRGLRPEDIRVVRLAADCIACAAGIDEANGWGGEPVEAAAHRIDAWLSPRLQ